jgi:ATP-dependent DNA helicase PIF1
VLKAFTKRLRAMGKKVQIVAPTGRAALQVNGQTTWTYAGWRPEHNRYPLDELLKNAHGERTWRRLNNKTDVLVIDEISMVENFHFGRLSELLKEARHQPHQPKLPFGGLQVIVTGDFCQLPPVNPFEHCFHCGARLVTRRKPYGKVYTCNKHGEFRNEDKWAFRSEAWEECNFVHVQLTQIHRQSDERFVSLLQKCRLGLEFTPEETDILMNHRDKVNRINATQLHATRDTVKQVNDERFAKLKTQCHTFWSLDNVSLKEEDQHLAYKGRIIEDYRAQGVSPPPGRKPRLGLADHRYEPCVQLKQGMLVVLLTNLDLESGLCNGSQGLIAGWEKYDPIKMPSARWSKNEEPGPGMKFSGDHALTKEIQVTNFIKDDATEVKAWPKVRFLNGVVRTIYADCSISEVGERAPYSLLMRTQIPLAPAWAMTIHKSQGMTLNQVIVYLSKAWEEGQVYVALSRATSLEGLKIDGSAAGLKVGLGGNREVQRFMREKFAARDPTVPAGQLTLPPPASQPKFFYDLGPNSRAILP